MGMKQPRWMVELIEQRCREAGTLPALPTAAPSSRDEKDFQNAVLKEAAKLGWLCYHTHDSRKSRAGFPDLTMVRRQRVIFAELKSATGKLDAAQETWREVLEAVGGNVTYCLWRPADWTSIMEILA